MKCTVAAALIATVAVVSSCSSAVNGSGSSGSRASTPALSTPTGSTGAGDTSTDTTDSAPPSTPNSAPLSATHSHSSHPSSSPASDTAAAGPAQVISVSYSVHCTSQTDTAGTVNLTWQTKGASAVYVLEGLTAGELVGADAKSAGGMGPFAANGSQTLAFACSADDDYYLVEAYNTSDDSHNGVVQQVPYS